MKIDSNGYVSGYELYNGGEGTSSFVLSVDKFLISRPGVANPKQMFVYDSESGLFTVPNILIDGAQIKDATIETANIKHGSITTPYLSTLSENVTYTRTQANEYTNIRGLQVTVAAVANTPISCIFGFGYLYGRKLTPEVVDPQMCGVYFYSPVMSDYVFINPLSRTDDTKEFFIGSYIWTPATSGTTTISIVLGGFDWGYTGDITISTPFLLALAMYR